MGDFTNDNSIREALAVAALVRFCGCFESTSGHRSKPLKIKKIFQLSDRQIFEALKLLRNKLVVHDEQLYPNHTPWVVVGPAGAAIEAGVLGMGFRLVDMVESDQFLTLAQVALAWVANEFDHVSSQVVEEINSLPPDMILQQVNAAGPLKITIETKN